MPITAYSKKNFSRNRFLAGKLKTASSDVKELVQKNRLKAGEGPRKQFVWADADRISEEEKERRNSEVLKTERFRVQFGRWREPRTSFTK